MNFEKIETTDMNNEIELLGLCSCKCQGTDLPLNDGVKLANENMTQRGSCIT